MNQDLVFSIGYYNRCPVFNDKFGRAKNYKMGNNIFDESIYHLQKRRTLGGDYSENSEGSIH